jgi:hypothetical protein
VNLFLDEIGAVDKACRDASHRESGERMHGVRQAGESITSSGVSGGDEIFRLMPA